MRNCDDIKNRTNITRNCYRTWYCRVCLIIIISFFSFLIPHLPQQAAAQGLPLIRNFTATEYGGHNRNFDIEIGEDGTVFVANYEGLLYYDRSQWRIIHAPDISRVTAIYRDSRNTIWVGGYNFMARLQKQLNGKLFMQRIGKEGLFEGEVMEIYEDHGSLQFVVSDNNIYEVQDDKISLKKHTKANFKAGVELDVVSIKALQEGRENVILEDITQTLKLDGGLQVQVKKNNGLIITDDQGHRLYTINKENGLCSNQVAYVDYDGHGILWGATAHGIFAIELPSVYSYFLPKDGLTGEVQTIAAYDGKIYAGGTNGLYCIAMHQCKRVSDINNICWSLSESHDGLLAATSSGIYKITKGGSINRLTSNATTALLIDGDNVYVGEPDGVYLYRISNGRWAIGKGQKIDDFPLVTDIRKDAHGGLWFRNVHGETKGTDPRMEKEPIASLPNHLHMPIKGLKKTVQYQHGSHVWIGGDERLTFIDADQKDLEKLSDCRTIRFCSIVMGSDSVLWGGYGDMPQTLPRLDSNERHLHFFYALNYAPLTGKTLYRYRLNKDKWSAWSERRGVEFLNLPYGSFSLSVQAQLANGELSEIASVNFSIAYPLPMRWYIVILYFIGFAYLIYLVFRYRLKKLEKDKIKLEQIVEERTADLRNAQQELIRQEKMASVGKLTEGLIDRILNPMNYIINFSKMSIDLLKDLKSDIGNDSTVRSDGQVSINEDDYDDALDVMDMLTENLQNVDQYGQNTTRILKAMEEMLKDRTGGYIDMDLLPILQQDEQLFNNYFANEKAQYHIQTVFNLPSDSMPIHGNPDMLSKTIMSLLGNAVYAVVKKAQRTPFDPMITFTATMDDGKYILKIHDNGIGIEENILDKIFNPFFTTKTTHEAAGIGLYLSHEIIQNHGGNISVASVKDGFTEFTITLPILTEQ